MSISQLDQKLCFHLSKTIMPEKTQNLDPRLLGTALRYQPKNSKTLYPIKFQENQNTLSRKRCQSLLSFYLKKDLLKKCTHICDQNKNI